MKYSGTISRGVKAPIIRKGDDLAEIVTSSLEDLKNYDGVDLNDGDIICITESVVAISQNNFVNIYDIENAVKNEFNNDTLGVVFPIMSRNRFATLLRGIKRAAKRIVLQLSYPHDEVGNSIVSEAEIFNSNINTYTDAFSKDEFKKIFPNTKHIYTGVDYLKFYQEIIGEDSLIILANDPREILKYTKDIIVADVHSRNKTKDILKKSGASKVISLDEILNKENGESGYNEEYGLLGANYVSDEVVKLFPRDSFKVVLEIQKKIKEKLGKHLEVLIYGDGAYKDPTAQIWELCDPVVAPGYTAGLVGTPNELKLKYIATKVATEAELIAEIKNKSSQSKEASLGTTPRKIIDLLGSLADLTSGSGDKGTPFVLIQNYFSNYSN